MRQNPAETHSSLVQPVVGAVTHSEDEPDVTYVGTVLCVRLSLLLARCSSVITQ